jgi:predicted nucleic acid-binding protein
MGLNLNFGDIIFLDTAPFIYFFERHPDYFPALETLFDRLYEVDAQAITSVITYIELTTLPARQGKKQLVRKYRDFLSILKTSAFFRLIWTSQTMLLKCGHTTISKHQTLSNSAQLLPVVRTTSSQMTRIGGRLKRYRF